MACISTIDVQTRLDVQELLSHFSHSLDRGLGDRWADLFTADGVFECTDGNRMKGLAELATLPSLVRESGRGAWRHLITAVMIERCNSRKELVVNAYCPVIDMNDNGAVAAFYDFEFTLRFASRWRISRARAQPVGSASRAGIGAISGANAAPVGISLQ